MKKISFIHCSDLHLGCRQFNEQQRFYDFVDSSDYIINYAIDRKVDFFIIAGDLFHLRNINAATLKIAMDLLKKLKNAGIEVIAIEGNHDKAFYVDEESWMDFLNSQGYIKLLRPYYEEGRLKLIPYDGEKGNYIKYDGLMIAGFGYLGATTWQLLEELAPQFAFNDDEFRILILHAAVDKLLGMDLAGIRKGSLEAFRGKVDYIALGHIHTRQELEDFIFNPGAPECVHIDEVRKDQEKGFYHVTVEDGKKQVEFVPSIHRKVFYFNINLTGIHLPEEAIKRVLHEIDSAGMDSFDRPMVQINLCGNVPFNSFAIDTGSIAENVKSLYNCLTVEVLNNTNLAQVKDSGSMPAFDRESVEKNVIAQMIAEYKPELGDMKDELARLILDIKNWSLTGMNEIDIAYEIEKMIDKPLFYEAAAAKEGDGNEN